MSIQRINVYSSVRSRVTVSKERFAIPDHRKQAMDTQRPQASRAVTPLLHYYTPEHNCQNMRGNQRETWTGVVDWGSGDVLLFPTPLEWHTVSHIISSLIYRQSSHCFPTFHAKQ